MGEAILQEVHMSIKMQKRFRVDKAFRIMNHLHSVPSQCLLSHNRHYFSLTQNFILIMWQNSYKVNHKCLLHTTLKGLQTGLFMEKSFPLFINVKDLFCFRYTGSTLGNFFPSSRAQWSMKSLIAEHCLLPSWKSMNMNNVGLTIKCSIST